MKKNLLLLATLLPSFLIAQTIPVSLKITFDLIVPSEHLYVYFNDEEKIDTFPFPSNGVWEYNTRLTREGTMQLRTDSPDDDIAVWLQQGTISFICKQTRNSNNRLMLSILNLEAPEDTQLFYKMTAPRSYRTNYPPGTSAHQRDSILKKISYDYAYGTIDSLLNTRPNSPIIPHYISFYDPALGAAGVRLLYNRLPEASKNTEEGQSIKEYLDRMTLLAPGTVFADFTMPDNNGKPFKLKDVHAKYILVDFWASWCGPCRAEHPHLLEVYDKFRKKGFEIIGVSLDEEKQPWLNAIEKDKLTWPQVSELNYRENTLAKKYKVDGIPFIVLLDENRKIVAIPQRSYDVEKLLTELLQ